MCNQTVCEVGVLVMLGIFGSLFAHSRTFGVDAIRDRVNSEEAAQPWFVVDDWWGLELDKLTSSRTRERW